MSMKTVMTDPLVLADGLHTWGAVFMPALRYARNSNGMLVPARWFIMHIYYNLFIFGIFICGNLPGPGGATVGETINSIDFSYAVVLSCSGTCSSASSTASACLPGSRHSHLRCSNSVA